MHASLYAAAAKPAEVIVDFIGWAILLVCIVVALGALIHCAMQRSDAFGAVGTLSKGLWLALLGGSILLSLMLVASPFGRTVGLIAVTGALVYLLDVRPAIRDISSGGGRGW